MRVSALDKTGVVTYFRALESNCSHTEVMVREATFRRSPFRWTSFEIGVSLLPGLQDVSKFREIPLTWQTGVGIPANKRTKRAGLGRLGRQG